MTTYDIENFILYKSQYLTYREKYDILYVYKQHRKAVLFGGIILELLLILVILVVLCICLGIDSEIIACGVIGLVCLFCVVYILFFIYSCTRIIVSKKCNAFFVRIDKSPHGKFQTAYYSVDGKEYANAFPCEIIMKKHIYRTDKNCNVRLDKKKSLVYDKNSVITATIGIAFSIVLMFGLTETVVGIFYIFFG